MVTELCRAGTHPMTPENAGVQRSTGRQFCRACKREYRRARRRERRPDADLCKKGLHDLSDPANAYVRPGTTRRECRACKAAVERERRAATAAAEAAEAEARAARRASRVVSPAGIRPLVYGVSPEAAARYRLARMVRGW